MFIISFLQHFVDSHYFWMIMQKSHDVFKFQTLLILFQPLYCSSKELVILRIVQGHAYIGTSIEAAFFFKEDTVVLGTVLEPVLPHFGVLLGLFLGMGAGLRETLKILKRAQSFDKKNKNS